MTTATERIPVLVTKKQKAILVTRAKSAGLSMGEFLRRAGENYSPSEDEVLLDGLLNQVAKSTIKASAAIDDAMAFVAASEKRMQQLKKSSTEMAEA